MSSPAEPRGLIPASARMTRDASAMVTWVEDSIVDVLGWSPAELVDLPSTRLIHPEDHGSAVAAWFEMISTPDKVGVWRGRYQTKDGEWVWVETINRNRLEDSSDPSVTTTMSRIEGQRGSVEERLRVQEQMLNRVADAIPVGLFQFDADLSVSFTNQRLHAIVETQDASTVEGLFADVVDADRHTLLGCLSACLADEPVDDVEISLQREPTRLSESIQTDLVCLLSLRALTDRHGVVTGGIGCVSDVTERVQLGRSLEHRANTDALTQCLSRSAILSTLAAELPPRSAGTAVVYVDLDGFKQVNDELGHAVGDQILRVAARRLISSARPGDLVGRIGGDEFLVVCAGVSDPTDALALATRLADAVQGTVHLGAEEVVLRASIGAAWSGTWVDPDALISHADRAMYVNKRVKTTAATLWSE